MGKSYRPIVVQTESFASQLLPQYPVFFAEVDRAGSAGWIRGGG
jgi:hypothetical protein